MGQLPGDRVTRGPLAATAPAPLIGFNDLTREDRAVGLEALASDDEAEFVEAAERGEIRVGEPGRAIADGSVRHTSRSFRMASVGTSILGRPRRLSRDRHASARYTLIWEEPYYPNAK